jgi:ankyrin repeat protein
MKTIGMLQIIALRFALCTATCIGATPSFSFTDTVPDVIIASQSPADFKFGGFVATGGDVNGDGYGDFVTTANRYNDGTGRAYLYFGAKARVYENADLVFDGEAPGDFFGMWILLADLNNDKYADVIVGAVGHSNMQGRVYVYFGGPDMDNRPDMIFDGEPQTCGWFGRVIDAADIDRDGHTDLIINAVKINKHSSRAYLYYGGNPMDTVADKIFDGENPGDMFGREMDMGPDVNGDGYGDIIFGSRSWNALKPIDSGQGRAYLYYGGPKETMDTICDEVFTGENLRDQLGSSVCLFDIDADGYAEVLVGARGYNSYQGRMYLYWGSRDIDTQPDLIFNGEKQSDFGGDNIDCGYFNDDKYGDILIGGYSGGPNRNGRIYLYYGAPKASMNTVCDQTFTGEGTMFGWQISIGNINGDAYDDFIVATGAKRPGQPRVSRAYVYYTKPFPQRPRGISPQFVEEISEDAKPIGSLHKAAAEGDVDQVKGLIAEGSNANSLASDSGMMTPLHVAAISGHRDVAEILLAHASHVNAVDNMHFTPLHRAVEHDRTEVVKLLIDKGADVNAENVEGETPLDIALDRKSARLAELLIENGATVGSLHTAIRMGSVKQVEKLIKRGVHVDVRDKWGQTPLHCAVMKSRKDITEILIAANADIEAMNRRGMTPLHYASQYGHKDIAELLIRKGADIYVKNNDGKTPLDIASKNNHIDIARLLLAHGAQIPNLRAAVQIGDRDRVKAFLEQGTDVNAKDGNDRTALHIAAQNKHQDIVELLLSMGADVNAGDGSGFVPLVYALWNTDPNMVKLLLDNGADVNAKDTSMGFSILHWAIAMDSKETAELVLAAGADVNAKSNSGETPLDVAAYGVSPAVGQLLIANGAEISSLHSAAYMGDLAKMKAFIDEGADVNQKKGMIQSSSLHAAAVGGRKAVVEFLISKGADVNAQIRSGQTPLHMAAEKGHLEVVELLLESGADVHLKDRRDKTPLDLALEAEHNDVVEALMKQMQIHDVAVVKVSAPMTCAQGDTVSIRVTVENPGDYAESAALAASDLTDRTEIGSRTITVRAGGQADLIFDSPATGTQQFGTYVYHGDVNADGYDDLLVTASRFNEYQGRAYLYFGGTDMDTSADIIFTGEAVGDYFSEGGWLGDLNGDGHPDVILGALGHDNKRGRVYVCYGGPDIDAKADLTIDGEPGIVSNFGRTCTSGDVNGDGYEDLFVGANRYSDDYTGRIYLYYGGESMDTDCDLILTGENPGDVLGWMIDASGDVDGDGLCDLVAATRWWPRSAPSGGNAIGRAYLYYGGAPMDAVCDVTFTGEHPGDDFGSGLEVADVDHDGRAEIFVGARGYDKYSGRVYMYWGKERKSMTNRVDVLFEAESRLSAFGGDDIEVGDIDADGYRDIAIAAYGYPNNASSGRVYLYHGLPQARMNPDYDRAITFPGRTNFVQFMTIGDFDNNGYGDLVVGGWGYPDGANQGRVWLYYGGPSKCTGTTFKWDTTNASIGKHTLKVEIPPVPGEQNTDDNIKAVTIEVKKPSQ